MLVLGLGLDNFFFEASTLALCLKSLSSHWRYVTLFDHSPSCVTLLLTFGRASRLILNSHTICVLYFLLFNCYHWLFIGCCILRIEQRY